MAIRKPKPTSPGRRFVSYPDFAEITKSKPEKSLVEGLKKSGGRNARGRTRAWKKAIVQVRAGESIPIFQGLAALDA